MGAGRRPSPLGSPGGGAGERSGGVLPPPPLLPTLPALLRAAMALETLRRPRDGLCARMRLPRPDKLQSSLAAAGAAVSATAAAAFATGMVAVLLSSAPPEGPTSGANCVRLVGSLGGEPRACTSTGPGVLRACLLPPHWAAPTS